MKRIALIIMTIFSVLMISSCTTSIKYNLVVQYDKANDLIIVTNGSTTQDYKGVIITLAAYNEDGYKLDVQKEIPELKQGEKCEFKLSELVKDIDKVQQIEVVKCTYEENMVGLCIVLVVAVLLIILRILIALD